ncbi:hypothetical protein [Streptomyces sp. NPDC048606]|uniref:hypothetical protein n=1 Tax=Streptomyces sp. NPDC048606 TaxID=3154726 RepID=UPI00343E62CE
MNLSSKSASESSAKAIRLVFGFLAIAVSLISVALTLGDDLGVGVTAALVAADIVLFAAMGALTASVRAEWSDGRPGEEGTDAARSAESRRDEELLDALEPLGPTASSSSSSSTSSSAAAGGGR